MKMFRKIIPVLIVVVLMVTFSACGKDGDKLVMATNAAFRMNITKMKPLLVLTLKSPRPLRKNWERNWLLRTWSLIPLSVPFKQEKLI